MFACPSCRASLSRTEGGGVACGGAAAHVFTLTDGAPVFLAPGKDDEPSIAEAAGDHAKWAASRAGRWDRERRRVWKSLLARAHDAAPPPGVFADVGAGGAGLASMAAHARYQAVALDAAMPPAGPYLRASASMALLPFADGTVRVAAFCASLHYAPDISAVLREARRVLRKDGVLVVALTPVHGSAQAAEAAARTTRDEIQGASGRDALARSYRHLVAAELRAALSGSAFSFEEYAPGFSFPFRVLRALKERVSGEEFARFPTVVARPIA